jgi:hypothetical protein
MAAQVIQFPQRRRAPTRSGGRRQKAAPAAVTIPLYRSGDEVSFSVEGAELSGSVEGFFFDEPNGRTLVIVSAELGVPVDRLKLVRRAADAEKGGAA